MQDFDCNEFAVKFIQKNIKDISQKIFDAADSAYKKLSVNFRTAFTCYIEASSKKYSKIKTLLTRDAPVDFYSVFECNSIRNKKNCIDNATASTLMAISNFVIVKGTGGIGKSMLMKHSFLSCLQLSEKIPVYIELKEYNESYGSFKNFLFSQIKLITDTLDAKVFEYSIKNGVFLFLLDGYDEIKSQYENTFLKQLDEFCCKYSSNNVIISSRPSDTFIKLQQFTVLESLPLSKEQSIRLIKKIDYSSDIKEKFINDLDKKLYKKHITFASNPLLLNIMLLTYESYAEIPDKLHIFYENAFETLYSRHDATKCGYKRQMKCKLKSDEFKKIFSEICFQSYMKKMIEFSQSDLESYINKCEIGAHKKIDNNFEYNFIQDLHISVCLIYLEGYKYKFMHRSFQEYFTAYHIKLLPDTLQKKVCIHMINNAQWEFDAVFDMLRDMDTVRFEQNLLIPLLTEFEEDMDDSEKETYYLKRSVSAVMVEKSGDKIKLGYVIKDKKSSFLLHFGRKYVPLTSKESSSCLSRFGKYLPAKSSHVRIPLATVLEDEQLMNSFRQGAGFPFSHMPTILPLLLKQKNCSEATLNLLLEETMNFDNAD